MMHSLKTLAVAFAFTLLVAGVVYAQTASQATKNDFARGEILYSNHCAACHSTQIHWRDKKMVKDWASLKTQVRRWQRIGALAWSDDEIEEVARYLNALYYHFAAPRLR